MPKESRTDEALPLKQFGLETKVSLLVESLNREKHLMRLLKDQKLRNDQLQLKLDMERMAKISDF